MPRSLHPQLTPCDDASPRGEQVLAAEHDALGLGITNRTADSRRDGGTMDVNTVIAQLYRADEARGRPCPQPHLTICMLLISAVRLWALWASGFGQISFLSQAPDKLS